MSDSRDGVEISNSADCPECPGKPVLERIESRLAIVGKNLPVRRAVPSPRRRMVGAWCFLDHAGPADFEAGQGLNVGPHPHIGLQTFTWMIEGEVMHYDSLGYQQMVRPGQVNLMTAGRGIAHAEVSPAAAAGRIHAAQLWIALPDAQRHRAPAFQHYPDLPTLDDGGFRVTVLAGAAYGQRAPAEVFTPLVGVDFSAQAPAQALVPLNPLFEHAVMCLKGAVTVAGERVEPGVLLYLGSRRSELSIQCDTASQMLLVGGEPFTEKILVWWNFVARTPEEIQKATADWNAGQYFDNVPNVTLPRLKAPDISGLQFKST